ncbi:unnamed protein product [Auanema sp. JU1783]|nr:unnamed protein product [Auanema sp. JU1783]
MPPSKKLPDYETNTRILCKHAGFFYDAKIIDKKQEGPETAFLIHYQGWHKRHDEWITQTESLEKFKDFSDEAHNSAKNEYREAKDAKAKAGKKKSKQDMDDELRKSETGSRASTPSDRAGGSTKANSITIANASTSAARGIKRKADDNSFVEPLKEGPNEYFIRMPKNLMQVLVDDHDMVNRHCKLTRLPARYTVEMIIQDYCESSVKKAPEQAVDEVVIEYENSSAQSSGYQLVQSALGIQDYFDTLLGFQLLYKFERQQYYDELVKAREVPKTNENEVPSKKRRSTKEPEPEVPPTTTAPRSIKPSKMYGLPHLLRLLSRFDVYLKLTSWKERTIKMITTAIHDFLVYLNKNLSKYYIMNRDYDVASPAYQRQATTL